MEELKDCGIVLRKVLADRPVRTEYSLTKKGSGLRQSLQALEEWAEKWLLIKNLSNLLVKLPHKKAADCCLFCVNSLIFCINEIISNIGPLNPSFRRLRE